ncbi:E3 ubiquitin-protein ligase Mdm2-like [Saccostrea echinata]|uniref:E3 ubiquitin-protein ligase Mdm2-like n=1 Tax=Saccostrea echinata TaxID=191078 RepID=UPI002A8251E0|nr:E3 ubiquitin-protein ligase Mdm2-like [Saccostrea echinata]
MAEGGVTDFSEQDQQQKFSNMETEVKQEKIPEESAGKAEGQDEGLSEFLERTKCDRMYELRQIQYGERPVTSTGRKNVIDSFFAKHMQAQEAKLESGKENVPVNVENVDEIRPETVVVEIQGLVEQQRVSNVLGTAFRRRLENIIRGTISNVSRGPRASPQPTTSHSSTPQPSPNSTNNTTPHSLSRDGTPSVVATPNSLSRESTPMEAEIQNIPRPVEQLQHEERSRSNSITSARSGFSTHSTTNSSGSSTRTNENESLPQPSVNNSQENHVNLGNIPEHVMEEMQQEEFIQEISELVHRQLVTSTLQGNFRTTLELTMRDHMRSTDSDGQRVQEFIQSLQPTQPIIRNDFSHLGIPLNNQDNLDNISVTSVSAQAVPYTQSNMYLSREMASLKAQVEEMKNMLKVSFDLQLDIQRAIRQEVAAAMSEKSDGTRETATSRQSRPVNDSHCLICLDKFSDSVLYQCGHMCVCYGCGRQLMSRGSKCPVCRAPIKDIIRAYRCNFE